MWTPVFSRNQNLNNMELTDGEWGLAWAGYCVCPDNIKSDIFNESFTSSITLFSFI